MCPDIDGHLLMKSMIFAFLDAKARIVSMDDVLLTNIWLKRVLLKIKGVNNFTFVNTIYSL